MHERFFSSLFRTVDNSPLIIFRIIFGVLICLESWGAIATGWVTRTLIEPKFTFNFIHLDFLQPLSGWGMYAYYIAMGIVGLGILLGYRYVLASALFCIMWGATYLMQKSSYNNHYYLLWLLSGIMCFLPANKDLSLDVRLGYTTQKNAMPYWCKFLIIAQLAIVYTYAAVAKLYPDWISTNVAANLMAAKANYPVVGQLLQQKWTHYVITYMGIIFDLLIIPALLFKPTRKIAFVLAIFFHLYNSIVFQIGIFPYLALSFSLFFFPAERIRAWFYPKLKKHITPKIYSTPIHKPILITLAVWLIIQIALPLRHWAIKGDVLYTEEGHRLSWRMMLRSKSGRNTFYIQKETEKRKERVVVSKHLSPKQIRSMGGKPDMIWQFAQHLKKEYAKKNIAIKVFVTNHTSVNRKTAVQLIDPNVDLAAVQWNYWGHNDWINTDFNKKQ
ncbi:HTTM domain-containing protein [Aquimarina agarivorans]|uniref:HTTM domain-containing protein n=1 Tax=Aquimarina agarivorans TaxID=980584 RepID=UPI000248E68B|nr:HTTM domain-containing protein [Aquimarina agarivorans]